MGGGLYTTSSQTFKSYGGGGNGGAMGGSMSNGKSSSVSSNPSLQGGVGVGLSSPIAYSTARRGDMSSASGDDMAMMAVENQMASLASAANAGMGNSFYGYSVMDYSSANYDQYTSMFGTSRSNVRGRQNAGEESTYANWLRWFDAVGWAYGTANGNNYSYDSTQAQNAYNAWVSTLSDNMPIPSYEVWLSWFMGKGTHTSENGNTYSFVPVGDILPLLLIALLYVLFIAIKSNLLKTERSE